MFFGIAGPLTHSQVEDTGWSGPDSLSTKPPVSLSSSDLMATNAPLQFYDCAAEAITARACKSIRLSDDSSER